MQPILGLITVKQSQNRPQFTIGEMDEMSESNKFSAIDVIASIIESSNQQPTIYS